MSVSKKEPRNSKVIVIVAIVTALSLLGDSMLYITLPIFWKEAGLDSIWQVGILLSINRFIRLPINPLTGWIYKRISLKTGLIIAVLLGAITTLGYGMLKGFIAWIILRGLWGIAWSFFRIGGLSIVAYYADENHRGEAMGQYNGLYRLGSLFGMLLGGIFVPIFGLKIVSITFGVLSLLGLPLIIKSIKTGNVSHVKQSPIAKRAPSLQSAFKNKVIIIISGFFITMLYQGVFTSTLSSVIERSHGQNVSIFGIVLSVTFLSGIIQSARWGWEPFLGKRFGHWSDGPKGRIPIFVISLLFAGLTFGMISSNLPFVIWIMITFLLMIAATSISTLTDAIALDTAKASNVVSFLTLYSIAQDVGAALGPFISYMLIELDKGFTYLYWGGAGIFTLLAILWSIVYKIEKKFVKQRRETQILM